MATSLNVMPESIKVISFNAGLIDVNLLGFSIVKPADHLEQRARMMASSLEAQDADVIAIQELYDRKHVDNLVDEMKGSFPFHYRKSTSSARIDNGLFLLSKFPIRGRRMSTLRSGPWDETVFCSKSIMSVQIAIDPSNDLNIINIHATSGGLLNAQDAEKITQIRQEQITQAKEIADTYDGDLSIILGDFNAGPEIAPRNYEFLKGYGYVDAYLDYCKAQKLEPEITWDAENILNVNGTHSDSISQRIDHIFLSPGFAAKTEIIDSKIIFKEAIVKIEQGNMVTISDHYGTMAELKFV